MFRLLRATRNSKFYPVNMLKEIANYNYIHVYICSHVLIYMCRPNSKILFLCNQQILKHTKITRIQCVVSNENNLQIQPIKPLAHTQVFNVDVNPLRRNGVVAKANTNGFTCSVESTLNRNPSYIRQHECRM